MKKKVPSVVLLEAVGNYRPETKVYTDYCRAILPVLIEAETNLWKARKSGDKEQIANLKEYCNNLAISLKACYRLINQILRRRYVNKDIRSKMDTVETRLATDYGELFKKLGL